MTWLPIAQSGIPFNFSAAFGTPELSGSVVSAEMQSGPAWDIQFDDQVVRNIRVVVQAYDSQTTFPGGEEPSFFTFLTEGGDVVVENAIDSDLTTDFDPNPVSSAGYGVSYTAGFGSETNRDESFTMQVEVEVTSTPRIKPILQTFRGYMEADNAFTTWVRTEEGQADLSEATVTIKVRPYSRPGRQVATLTATADAMGRVDFDIPALTTTQQLAPGLYRLELVAEQGETAQVIQVGLLELA